MSPWGWPALRPSPAMTVGTVVNRDALDVAALGQLLQPTQRDLRARLYELFREDIFSPRHGVSLAEERNCTWLRIQRLAQEGVFRDTVTAVGADIVSARERYDTAIACAALVDHSLEVKLGVSLGLFGTTVRRLGSEEQFRKYLPDIESMKEFGCFALTGAFRFLLPSNSSEFHCIVLLQNLRCVGKTNYIPTNFTIVRRFGFMLNVNCYATVHTFR